MVPRDGGGEDGGDITSTARMSKIYSTTVPRVLSVVSIPVPRMVSHLHLRILLVFSHFHCLPAAAAAAFALLRMGP